MVRQAARRAVSRGDCSTYDTTHEDPLATRHLVCAMMFGTVFGACVERAGTGNQNQGVSAQETDAIRRRVASTTAPTPHHRLDFNFGNKLTLLGYDISPEQLRPGTSAT